MPAVAETAEKSFASASSSSNQQSISIAFDKDAISGKAEKGSGSNLSIGGSSGSRYLNLQNKNQLTITAADGYVMTRIEITCTSSSSSWGSTTYYTGGSKTNKTVSATNEEGPVDFNLDQPDKNVNITMTLSNADKVVLSHNSSTAMRIRKIVVTYEKEVINEGGGDNEGGDVELVDEDSYILEGDGNTPFYIRNKATGLYVKYGGSYGMDAIEGRAAHPFKAYKNNDNTYSLGTIHGYFNSMYSQASLFMDRPKSESNWKIEAVAGESGVYYLRGENDRALASVGNIYGILEFRVQDADDIFQRWELVTENELLSEMGKATKANPVDITPVIKGAAFDYADHKQPGNQFFTAEETPFYGEITEEAGSLQWNNTPVEERIVGNGILNWEDAEHSEWQLTHSYVNYWDGFKRMEHYGARWSDDPSVGSNTNLNGIGLSRNNIHNEYMVEQYIGELPAGTYVLSYQGFYATTYSGEVPTVSVATATGDADLADEFSDNLENYTNSSISSLLSSSADNRGLYVATMFRDNRENDSYRDSIQFKLTEPKHVGIRIHKNETNPETGGDYGSRYQWMIAFDDFTLIYQGNENTVVDQAILYYDRVKAAYLHATKKLYELAGKSYTNCTTVANNACVHWDEWDEAIENVVIVNGISENSLRGNTVTTPTNKFAYLNGTATSNKIDTEKEFLEALAKIEEAYQAALKEHNSHLTDFTGEIGNPSFEMTYEDGSYFKHVIDGNSQTAQIPYWNTVPLLDWHDNIWYEWYHDPTVVMEKGNTSCDGGHYFNSWHSNGHSAVPIQQTITLDKGLYELSALVASSPNQTVFLTADTYHNGTPAQGENSFVDHKLQFLVEDDNTEVTIGAIGGDGDAFNLYDPRHGGFFRADHFRLTRIADVPNGRVRLALEEVKKTALDAYGLEVLNLSDFENMVNNDLVSGDGATEIETIFANMKEATLAQKTREADMTWAISNANFELGTTDGWTYTKTTGKNGKGETIETGETGVYPHTKHKASIGADGRFLFNTWDADQTKCKEIYQEITGLRNGTYRLSAMVASSNGNKLTLKAGGVSKEVTCIGDNDMVEVSCEFSITEGPSQEVTIGVYNNATWYKADNFRLTYLHNKLALDHADTDVSDVKADWYTDVDLLRPMTNVTWNSFVVPYNMPVPENWDVRQLVDGTITGDHLSMTFERVTEIVAGTPYMVRYYPQGVPTNPALDVNTDDDTTNDDPGYNNKNERITYTTLDDKTSGTISSEYTDVNTSIEPTSDEKEVVCDDGTGTLRFVGSYIPTDIPVGAIFISDNKFYVSKGNSKIKGYRGYIVPGKEAAKARTFGMRTRGGDDTGIESANNEEATVVGIYDINGVKLNEIQDGMNILRMSDGSTIKIMMK